MSLKPLEEDWHRAICVVAHPDDLEYGVAAAVARWTGQGKRIAYVLATRGEAGIDGMAPDKCGPLREAEERRGAQVVGVSHVEFLGYPDGGVEYSVALRRDIAVAIRRLRPDVVVTANFDLTWGGAAVNHADHRALGLAALDAPRDAANRWLFPDEGEPWAGVRACLVAGADEPTHFVDVADTLEAGVASLLEHKRYLEGLGQEASHAGDFLRTSAARAGEAAGCEAAVLFRRFAV